MTTYELTYIISPEVSLEETDKMAKEVEALIQANEGVVVKQEKPTAKTLSYPIKKHASGFVGVIEFQMEAEKLGELQLKMQKDEKVVRHMVIIKHPVKIKKMRRQRASAIETTEAPIVKEREPAFAEKINEEKEEIKKTEEKPKVELKDIEQKLDEILGE